MAASKPSRSTSNNRFRANRFAFAAALICGLVIPAVATSARALSAAQAAGNNSASAGAATSKPERQKKIYTNDDIAALARDGATTVGNAAPTDVASPDSAGRILVPGRKIPIPQPVVAAGLPPEKNPIFYAQQYASLSARIADIDNQLQRLRNFRASDAAPGSPAPGFNVGLNIYAATDGGITTDAQIHELLAQRATIESEMSGLEDRARANDIAPEVLRSAPQIAAAAENSAVLSTRDQVLATRDQLDQLQSALAEVDDTRAAMHQQAAAQNIPALIPETKYGGGFTADYLNQLKNAQSQIQQQISTVEDAARHQGISPGAVR